MKGVDYSNKLSKEREFYQDALQKNKEASDNRIANTNERTDHILKKQTENHIKEKIKLEKDYETNLNNIKEKTTNSISETSKKLQEERERERQDFSREAVIKRQQFDQRLKDIQSSYKDASESESDHKKEVLGTYKKKYDQGLSDYQKKSDKSFNDYREKLSGAGQDAKLKSDREKQQLSDAHREQLTNSFQEASKKNAQIKNHLETSFKAKTTALKDELDQQKENSDHKIGVLKNHFKNETDKISKDYSLKNDEMVKQQYDDTVKSNKEHQNQLTDVQREYNKKYKMIELDKRRRNNGSGEFAQYLNRQQGLKDSDLRDSRFEMVKNQFNDTARELNDRFHEQHESHMDSRRKESTDATALMDRKLNEAMGDKIRTVATERESAQEKIDIREKQNRNDKIASEDNLALEKRNAQIRLTKLKENFNTSMKQIENKHRLDIADVTTVANKDKDQFVKNLNAQRSEEIFQMNREFDKMMDTTVQDYEMRLAKYQRENEYLKLTMDQKVKNVTDMAEKNIESQRILTDERRSSDLKNYQVMMDQRENKHRSEMNQTQITYQKKIDKLVAESDTKLKLLTNDYENKLKELKVLTNKELNQKDVMHKVELDKIQRTYEEDKARMASSHEERVSTLQTGHKEQLQQMKDFKRLS